MKVRQIYLGLITLGLFSLILVFNLASKVRKNNVLGDKSQKEADNSVMDQSEFDYDTDALVEQAIEYVKNMDQYQKLSDGEIELSSLDLWPEGKVSVVLSFPLQNPGQTAEARVNFQNGEVKEVALAKEGINQMSQQQCQDQQGRLVSFDDQKGCLPEEMIIGEILEEDNGFFCCLLVLVRE